MKKLIALFFLACATLFVQAQDLSGDWKGMIKAGVMDVRLALHVKHDTAYKATIVFLDQGNMEMVLRDFEQVADSVIFSTERFSYRGKLTDGKMVGKWIQPGNRFDCDFEPGKWIINRPHTPLAPFPYRAEDVSFVNPDVVGVALSGTLTLPQGEGPYPLAILLSGSGPSNRDEEIMQHKPFWVIADYLTRRGIAVLRYDDRGVGRSTGSHSSATTADFAEDAKAALAYVRGRKDLNLGKVGYIGHSEGGMIGQIAAADAPEVGFLVLLASPGVPTRDLMVEQTRLVMESAKGTAEEVEKVVKVNSTIYDIIIRSKSVKSGRDGVRKYLQKVGRTDKEYTPEVIQSLNSQMNNLWFRYFLKYDPANFLPRVHCPVLALNGARDIQVPSQQNLPAIGKLLTQGGNTNHVIQEFPGLNHLFQPCTECTIGEYGIIEETFSHEVLQRMVDWFDEKIK